MEYSKDIIKRMKDNLLNPPNKIEGSFSMDNLGAVAVELSKVNEKLEEINNNHFLDTTKGVYLDRKALDYGMERKKATKSTGFVTFTGEEGTRIDEGCIIASDTIEYITVENAVIEVKSIKVPVIALNSGSDSNIPQNVLTKIKTPNKVFYRNKIPTVTNEKEIINGTNDEHDEDFRERIYFKIQSPATSGNIAHYKLWAESVDGVGLAKVTPLIEGPGTVGVSIINSNNDIADSELIRKVQKYIADDNTGGGMAPIGARVIVSTARIKTINISVTLTVKSNTVRETVKNDIKANIEKYFKKIAYRSKNISLAKISDIIFDNENIEDLENLRLNENTNNVRLLENEIAKLGNFEVNYA